MTHHVVLVCKATEISKSPRKEAEVGCREAERHGRGGHWSHGKLRGWRLGGRKVEASQVPHGQCDGGAQGRTARGNAGAGAFGRVGSLVININCLFQRLHQPLFLLELVLLSSCKFCFGSDRAGFEHEEYRNRPQKERFNRQTNHIYIYIYIYPYIIYSIIYDPILNPF